MNNIYRLPLVLDNAPNLPITKLTSNEDFFLFFLQYATYYFRQHGDRLESTEPLNGFDAGLSETATLMVNGELFGTLYILSVAPESPKTMFFHSKTFQHKYYFIEDECIEEVTAQVFVRWARLLHSFFETYQQDLSSSARD